MVPHLQMDLVALRPSAQDMCEDPGSSPVVMWGATWGVSWSALSPSHHLMPLVGSESITSFSSSLSEGTGDLEDKTA